MFRCCVSRSPRCLLFSETGTRKQEEMDAIPEVIDTAK